MRNALPVSTAIGVADLAVVMLAQSRRTRPCGFRSSTAVVMLAQSRRTRPRGIRCAAAVVLAQSRRTRPCGFCCAISAATPLWSWVLLPCRRCRRARPIASHATLKPQEGLPLGPGCSREAKREVVKEPKWATSEATSERARVYLWASGCTRPCARRCAMFDDAQIPP